MCGWERSVRGEEHERNRADGSFQLESPPRIAMGVYTQTLHGEGQDLGTEPSCGSHQVLCDLEPQFSSSVQWE